MDSRYSGTKKNKVSSTILLRSRKKEIHLGFTTQHFGQIDKRIRDVTEFVAEPELNKNETLCRVYVYSVANGKLGRVLRSFKFLTAPFFQMYNTNEIVEPFVDEDEKPKEETEEEQEIEEKKETLDEELGLDESDE